MCVGNYLNSNIKNKTATGYINNGGVFWFGFVVVVLAIFFLVHVSVCMHVLYVHTVYVWCPQRPDEGVRAFGTEDKENCKPPRAFWEPHPVLVEEQQMLLATEPTF